MLRVVVAGCRDYHNYQEAKAFIDEILYGIDVTEITFLSGRCRGADMLGERYAKERGISIEYYPADWNKYKNAAGPIRNRQMAEASDMVICFWDGKSRGTASMIREAQRLNRQVKIKYIN